jgi:hypothetical protein
MAQGNMVPAAAAAPRTLSSTAVSAASKLGGAAISALTRSQHRHTCMSKASTLLLLLPNQPYPCRYQRCFQAWWRNYQRFGPATAQAYKHV